MALRVHEGIQTDSIFSAMEDYFRMKEAEAIHAIMDASLNSIHNIYFAQVFDVKVKFSISSVSLIINLHNNIG